MERKHEDCSYPEERPLYCQSCKTGCTRDPETCRVKQAADRRSGNNGCALFAMAMIGIVMVWTGEVFKACSWSMNDDPIFGGASVCFIVIGFALLASAVATVVLNKLGRTVS